METEPILSICIPTYNHEKYIVEALDSVYRQKTTYPFEVLVGEDCSTDNTKSVLIEYESRHNYSNLFVFYRENNMNDLDIFNAADLRMRARGKYLITLEGDDFWIAEDKIQKQIEFLENHTDYIAVAHNCMVVDRDSNPLNESYPECTDEEYTIKQFASGLMPGQLATIMCRNFYKMQCFDKSLVNRNLVPGDKRIVFSLLNYGKIHCIQQTMSAYRHVTSSSSSFSATHRYNYMNEYNLAKAYLLYSKNAEIKKYAEFILLFTVQSGIKRKAIGISRAFRDSEIIPHKTRAFLMLMKRDVKRLISKKVYFRNNQR